MAKFVSDIKTQLPANKVLITDENSIIKTSNISEDQIDSMPLIVDKYTDLPTENIEEGQIAYVKNDGFTGSKITSFIPDTMTDLYISSPPSIENMVLPTIEPGGGYIEQLRFIDKDEHIGNIRIWLWGY